MGIFLRFFVIIVLLGGELEGRGQTPVPMISQSGLTYTEGFSDIANWGPNFASGTGASSWKGVVINSSGTIGDGVRTTTPTTTFATSTSAGGVHKGTGNIQLLSVSTANSCAIDFFVDFTSVNASSISFDLSTIFNQTGDRDSKLKLFYSTDGSTYIELTGTNLPFTARNNVAQSATVNVTLPAALNGSPAARFRFYEYSTTGGTTPTGSQPKISIDNVTVSATASSNTITTSTSLTGSPFCITGTSGATVSVPYSTTGTFNSGSVFTAQLGATSAFSTPTSIGTGASPITATIPAGTASGTTYRIRVVASSPATNGTDNGSDLTVVLSSTNNVTSPGATAGNAAVTLNWTNPVNCFNDVMIVASTSVFTSAVPSGNAYVYSSNSFTDGANGSFDGGTIVYKGVTSPQTITNLANGTAYNFKIFVRNGSSWSSGTVVSATPVIPTSPSDYFRSNSGSAGTGGAWSTVANWQSSVDGVTWVTATVAPTSAANTITIRSGHNISVASTQGGDQITVNTGAVLTVSSGGTFTIADGTGTDLTVDGTVTVAGGTITQTGQVAFSAAANYIHAVNGGTIPTATWNSTSTCTITGMTSSAPGGMGQSFGIFIWNCTGQTTFLNINNSAFAVRNTLTITSTNTSNLALVGSTSTSFTNTIKDLVVNGGTFYLNYFSSSAGGIATLNVTGNVIVANVATAVLDFGGGTGNPAIITYTGIMNLAGDLTINKNSVFRLGSTAANSYGQLNFTGTALQNINVATGTVTNRGYIDYWVTSGAQVQLSNTLSLMDGDEVHVLGKLFTQSNVINNIATANNTYVEVHAAGTFVTTVNAGINSPGTNGAIQTDSRILSSDGNYEFRGTNTGTFGTTPLAATVRNLTINSSGTTLASDLSVTGALSLQQGVFTVPTSVTLTIAGTMPSPVGTITATAPTSTIALTNSNFTLNSSLFTTPGTVSNLTNNSAGTNTLSGDFTITRTLTLVNGVLNNGNNSLTLQTGGSVSPLVRSAGTLTMGSASSLTFGTATSNATLPDGVFTVGPAITNLTVSRGTTLTLGNQGMVLSGALSLTTGTLNIGSGLLHLNGASLSATGGFLAGSATSDFTAGGTTGGAILLPLAASISLQNCSVAGSRTVKMDGTNNINLYGAMSVGAGATFDNGGESAVVNGGGTPSITIDGTFITRDVQGFSGINAAIPGISPTLNTGCTVEYGLAGDQTVSYRTDYKNLTFSGNGLKTLTSGFNPAGIVLIKDAAIVEASNYTFGDNATSLSMTGGRLKVAGVSTKPDMRGTYTLTGGTIEFANAAATQQDIRLTPSTGSITYNNIDISGSNVGLSTSTGSLKMNTGSSFAVKAGATFNVQNSNGFFGFPTTAISNNNAPVIVLEASSTILYNSGTPQTITPATYQNITISNAGSKTLGSGDMTVNEVLKFSSGPLTTNNNKVIIAATGSVSGAGASTGWVAGYLQKQLLTTGPLVFEIGGAANYRPINFNVNAVSNAGNLTAYVKQTAGVYSPLIGSGLDGSKTLLRHFNLSGTFRGSVDAQFIFASSDVQAGSDAINFVVRTTPDLGTNWNVTTVGSRTANSTGASFAVAPGDYVIGNSTTLTVTGNPSPQTSCTAASFSATASATPSATATPIAVRWQENNGTDWADVTAGGMYSVLTTGSNPLSSTLTISAPSTAMSGFTYRAVFTDFSGDAFSSAAALTVTPNTWTASKNNVWSNAANWSCNVVPGPMDNVIIPSVSTLPTIFGNSTVNDLDINLGAYVTLNGNVLTVNGTLSGTGTITGSATSSLSVIGTGTVRLTPVYPNNLLQNFTVNSTGAVTLASNMFINNLFTPASGTINVNNVVTLMAGTGGQAIFPNTGLYPNTATIGKAGGTLTYGASGAFVLERYIPQLRRYRLLTPAVTATGTIRDNWQEGGSFNRGYGTHITGTGGTSNGFDQTATNNPSLFVFDNVSQVWSPVITTTANNVLKAGSAWRMLVRGDRTLDLYDPSNHPPETPAILRTKGQILTGNVKFAADGSGTAGTPLLNGTSGKYSLIGNPYYAPLNWEQMYNDGGMHNLGASYTTIDPHISIGTSGVYVTYNAVTQTNNFEEF